MTTSGGCCCCCEDGIIKAGTFSSVLEEIVMGKCRGSCCCWMSPLLTVFSEGNKLLVAVVGLKLGYDDATGCTRQRMVAASDRIIENPIDSPITTLSAASDVVMRCIFFACERAMTRVSNTVCMYVYGSRTSRHRSLWPSTAYRYFYFFHCNIIMNTTTTLLITVGTTIVS